MAAQAVKADVTCGRADVTSMAKKAPREGVLKAELTVGGPDTRSVGLPAVVQTLKIAQEQTGPVRAPKAASKEATQRRLAPLFFAEHSVVELREDNDFWLGLQGRLTLAMLLDGGATHHRPGGWDGAFGVIEEHFRCTRLMPWAGPVVPQPWFQAERIP